MAPHRKVLVNASIRDYLCKNDFSRLSKASRKQSKKKVQQSFESTNNSEIFNVSGGGNPTFFALCQSCKIVSSCRAWSSERPGPGAFALPRCSPQGGCDDGLDDGLVGALMDGIEWWVIADFLKSTFEVIEDVLICWRIRLLLIRAAHCCLFAQSLLCLCSPLLPLLLKFHRM